MLKLTRKVGERIVVGDRIIVSVEQIKPGRVLIGIQTPLTTGVLREELLTAEELKILEENARNHPTEDVR
jgi:carbon storage regulator CsrA